MHERDEHALDALAMRRREARRFMRTAGPHASPGLGGRRPPSPRGHSWKVIPKSIEPSASRKSSDTPPVVKSISE